MARKIKKNLKDVEQEIEEGPQLEAQADEVQAKEGEIKISKEKPKGLAQANEFGEGYTMQVIADNEPEADIFRIPRKDPNFEYRFIRDTKENMSVKTSNLLYMKGGWQIVPTPHLLAKCGIDKGNLHTDGSYHVGELVLCFMPKSLFLKKRAEDQRKTDLAMSGVKRLVEEGDLSRVNIKDVNGVQPGRMDGGRVVFDGNRNRKSGSVDVLKFGSHNSVE